MWADITDLAGVGQRMAARGSGSAQASLWQPAAQRCNLPMKLALLGQEMGGVATSTGESPALFHRAWPEELPTLSSHARSTKPPVPGLQAEPGRRHELRQQSQG